MSAIEGRAVRVSAGTQSGCSKSCSHDYYLRYLQQSVYRARSTGTPCRQYQADRIGSKYGRLRGREEIAQHQKGKTKMTGASPGRRVAGRVIKKQHAENLRIATERARAIVKQHMAEGQVTGHTMNRKRGTVSDETTIDKVCTLVANGATVVDALNEAQIDRQDWYRWKRENYLGANDKYQDAALCYLELMADRTLKVFEDLETQREAAKQALRDRTALYWSAQNQHEINMRKWRSDNLGIPVAERGEAPMYEGPQEPKYDGPEEWELSLAKEKAAMWKFHLQAGLERFRKAQEGAVNVNHSILHTIDVSNIEPGKALETYHRLIEGKVEK